MTEIEHINIAQAAVYYEQNNEPNLLIHCKRTYTQ